MDTAKGKRRVLTEMDCHRVLISNGLDHLMLPQLGRPTWRICPPTLFFSSLFVLRRRAGGVFISFLPLCSFTPNVSLHSHFLSSSFSRCLHDHSFFQHSTVRAIQCHFLGQSANSPPSRPYGRTFRVVSYTNLDSPSKSRVGLEDEHGSCYHLPTLSGRDDLYSLSR